MWYLPEGPTLLKNLFLTMCPDTESIQIQREKIEQVFVTEGYISQTLLNPTLNGIKNIFIRAIWQIYRITEAIRLEKSSEIKSNL